MLGFKSIRSARILISGIEKMHMIRKGQLERLKEQSSSAADQLPGRPEEFHLQPPTEPCVKLSLYTARHSFTRLVTAIPLPSCDDKATRKGDRSSWFPSWRYLRLSGVIPFAPRSLQALHHSYGMNRPLHAHQYFPPSCFALIEFSFGIGCRVPKFHT